MYRASGQKVKVGSSGLGTGHGAAAKARKNALTNYRTDMAERLRIGEDSSDMETGAVGNRYHGPDVEIAARPDRRKSSMGVIDGHANQLVS